MTQCNCFVFGLLPDRRRDAVGAEDNIRTCRYFGDGVDKHDTFLFEIIDDILIVDDLMKHVERRAMLRQGPIDALDCHFDAGTKAAGLGENHFFNRHKVVFESG